MDELERFLEFWYGPRKPEYGEPEERLRKPPLPEPLRRFYAFAGRWPSPQPGHGMDFFYTGSGGHHLHDLDFVKLLPDHRLQFFMEYQGDWNGLTLPEGEDPPVWIRGYWDDPADDELDDDERNALRPKFKQVSDALSKFLITHCLMTSLYEWTNSPCNSTDDYLATWFRRSKNKTLIWTAEENGCPWYHGSFFLFEGSILVHQIGSFHQFGAIHRAGIELFEQRLKSRPGKDKAGGDPKRPGSG
jgi:hypothetical protein